MLGASPSRTDLVFSKESFVGAFGTILNENSELSDTDYDVLLLYLSRDKGAIAYDGKVCDAGYILDMIKAKYMLDDQIPAHG